jgi:hypothetical protein
VQQFDPLQIQAVGGTLGGMFELAVLEDGIRWKTDFSGRGMIIEDIFTQLSEESERVLGILNAQVNLSGRSDADPQKIWRSINGKLNYRVKNAQFQKSPLIKSMLLARHSSGMLIPGLQQISLANLLLEPLRSRGQTFKLNQVYFHRIKGAIHITDGLAHTKDSFFDGHTLDLLLKGDVDLVKEDYNMRVKATPLGTIGSILRKTPLVGRQIERLRKTTLSFSFNVTGSFDDPNVQLTEVESINPKKKE